MKIWHLLNQRINGISGILKQMAKGRDKGKKEAKKPKKDKKSKK